MPKKLTEKEQLFCQEYLVDLNATAAAQRAGYSAKSYEALRQQASQILTKPHIAARLSELMAERSRRTGINADRVLQEIARIAFSTITDVVQMKHGEMQLNMDEPSEDDFLAHLEWQDKVAAVAEIDTKETKDGEIIYKVKMHDKTRMLALLMKHLGMLNDFDLAVNCLRVKYGLQLRMDDNGKWQVIDLTKVAAE